MFNDALTLLSQSDTFAVIEFLDQQEDQLEVAQTYSELVKHLYWQEKNVPDMVALARAGIQYALAAGTALFKRDLEKTLLLRGEAKTIAYNLASFTWIGWDEPGIVLDRTEQCYGLEAARMNLRFAFELDKGDMRIARAYWMLGAQLLAAGELRRSQESFNRAATYAVRAKEKGDELIARGFELLVALLQEPAASKTQEALAGVKEQLLQVEHGQMFVNQIDTARRVFNQAR
jgi:hypothetical protein